MTNEEILKLAKEKYPIGTVYVSKYSINQGNSIEESTYIVASNEIYFNGLELQVISIQEKKYNVRGFIYYSGKWAEIISTPNKTYELW